MKYFAWVFFNVYGYLFGFRFLAPLHHAIANISLHAMGYDNSYRNSWTGEEWFLKEIVSPSNPRVCFDVGANVGNYTRMLLKYCEATIYAIEPTRTSFEALKNIKDPRVIAIKAAAADFNGESIIYSKGDKDEKASLDIKVRGGNEEHVTVVTVEALAKKYSINEIDFIKVDTEGYEREVLKGLGAHRPKFIQFEFNIHHLYRNCTILELTSLLSAYTFYRLLPHGMVKINPKKFVDNIFMFCNIVAIRDDLKVPYKN